MSTLDQTVHFDFRDNNPKNVHETLETVYKALEEKGYNPINQIVGYIMSGDARNLIRKHKRDEIIEELVRNYLGKEQA